MNNNIEVNVSKKNNTAIIILSLLLIVAIGFIVFLLTNNNKESNNTTNNTEEKEEKIIKETTSNFSEESINYFLVFNYFTESADREELYRGNKVTANNLSDEYKNRLAFAYYMIKNRDKDYQTRFDGAENNEYGESQQFLKSSKIENSFKELFGKNSKYVAKSFDSYGIGSLSMDYNKSKDVYFQSNEGGDFSFYRYGKELYKVVEKENSIELYEYVVVYNMNTDTYKVGAFKDINDARTFTNPIKETVDQNNLGAGSIIKTTFDEKYKANFDNLADYKNEASQYKITLTKEENNYIFKSIEKIN